MAFGDWPVAELLEVASDDRATLCQGPGERPAGLPTEPAGGLGHRGGSRASHHRRGAVGTREACESEIDADPKVQAMKASRFWEHRRPMHLLTRLVRCAHCGGDMASVGRDYLACANARKLGRCDQRKSIRRAVLEEESWSRPDPRRRGLGAVPVEAQ